MMPMTLSCSNEGAKHAIEQLIADARRGLEVGTVFEVKRESCGNDRLVNHLDYGRAFNGDGSFGVSWHSNSEMQGMELCDYGIEGALQHSNIIARMRA